MKKKTVTALSWLAVAACMAVIFIFSSQTGESSQEISDRFAFLLKLPFGSFIVRKGAHFLEFAGLAALVHNALYQTTGKVRYFSSFAVTAVYAATDEIHQLFVGDRAGRLFDWFVDCAGATSALVVLFILTKIFINVKRRRLH